MIAFVNDTALRLHLNNSQFRTFFVPMFSLNHFLTFNISVTKFDQVAWRCLMKECVCACGFVYELMYECYKLKGKPVRFFLVRFIWNRYLCVSIEPHVNQTKKPYEDKKNDNLRPLTTTHAILYSCDSLFPSLSLTHTLHLARTHSPNFCGISVKYLWEYLSCQLHYANG